MNNFWICQNTVYLEDGNYVLKMNIYGSFNSTFTVNLIADYIKLIPTEPETVGIGKTYFEFEDYDNMLITDNSNAHGKSLFMTHGCSERARLLRCVSR